jgi:hypothetical protein
MRISSHLKPELALKSAKKLQTIGDLQQNEEVLRGMNLENLLFTYHTSFKIINTFLNIILKTGKPGH